MWMSTDQPYQISSPVCCEIPETQSLRGFRSILQMNFTKRNSASQLQDARLQNLQRMPSYWILRYPEGCYILIYFDAFCITFRPSKVSLHLAVSRPKMPCMSSSIQILPPGLCRIGNCSFHTSVFSLSNYAIHFGMDISVSLIS